MRKPANKRPAKRSVEQPAPAAPQPQPTPHPQKKKGALGVLAAVLLCGGASCGLIIVAAAGYFLYQGGAFADFTLGASPRWSAAEVDEARQELQHAQAIEQFTGEELQEDTDRDGQVDELSYQYPSEMVAESVLMTPGLVYRLGKPGDVPGKEIRLGFQNLSQEEQAFQLTYDIPKSFATSLDELMFSLEPAQVIDPDPTVVFHILLGAPPAPDPEPADGPGWSNLDAQIVIGQAAAMAVMDATMRRNGLLIEASEEMEKACKKLPADQRSECWLSMVDDFQEVLPKDKVKALCMETTALDRRICLAMANGDVKECDGAAGKQAIQVCKGYYIDRECSKLDGGERQNCLKSMSIQNKAFLACGDLDDPDVQNECYALAGGGAGFCDRINNLARRDSCKQAVQSSSARAGTGPSSSDPEKWWQGGQAEAACRTLASGLPRYTLIYSDSGGDLTCGFNPASAPPDQIFFDARVDIMAYPTDEEARAAWDQDYGADSQMAKTQSATEQQSPGRYTVERQSVAYTAIMRHDHLEGTTTFDFQGGVLYRNAIVRFSELNAPDTSTDTWDLIQTLARQIIDAKNR